MGTSVTLTASSQSLINHSLNPLIYIRWKGRRQSSNVEDRRGTTVRGGAGGGGRGGPAMGGAMGSIVFALFKRGSGKTKLILIVGVIAACFLFKINPLSLLGFSSGGGGGGTEMVQNPIKRHSITSPP